MRIADLGQAALAVLQWPQKQSIASPKTITTVPFLIAEDWTVLGPFQIGTREAIWGADPLERFGGFHTLADDDGLDYASTLAFNGSVTWSKRKAAVTELPQQEFSAILDVSFPEIDWTSLQQVYGWSALQWQAWARGKLVITSDEPVLIWMHLKQVLEFWVDDQHYFGGDLYGFNRAPTTLLLNPGEHTIELRLVRDVRAMGGITDKPNVEANVHISVTHEALRRSTGVLLPDRLDNALGPTSSTFASVVLRNDDKVDIFIDTLQATQNLCTAKLLQPLPIKLVPGQSRPIRFQLSCLPGTSATVSIKLFFYYHSADNVDKKRFLFVWGFPRSPQPHDEPHLITYQHPSGVVSYAVIKPPLVNICPSYSTLPILLLLHGAGVEADDDQTKHSMDDLPPVCAWTLFPSGVTSWSGDDWHDWGWADVHAAIDSIPLWIEQTKWEGPGVDLDRWVVAGHSNGGQGTWHALTHFADKIIAAAPVSGYASIQAYVPYVWWLAADPGAVTVIQSALSSHQNELLLENAADIPVLIQHGSADDNVPAYHSRLMHTRLQALGSKSDLVEIEDRPHWWDGVMTTPSLMEFFDRHLSSCESGDVRDVQHGFKLVVSNPGNTGAKNGVKITELSMPGRLGSLTFDVSETGQCQVRTRNVRSIELSSDATSFCDTLKVDGNTLPLKQALSAFKDQKSGMWTPERPDTGFCHRSANQYGSLEAILRSKGTFQIVQHSSETDHIALQVANNLCQYFGADVAVADSYKDALEAKGVIISIAIGADLPSSALSCKQKCAISVQHSRLMIQDSTESQHTYSSSERQLTAAAFLRPLPNDRLELVLWASEATHVGLLPRFVPTVTGTGHPDFVIASTSMSYAGIGGALALGFFDGDWCAAATSYFVDS